MSKLKAFLFSMILFLVAPAAFAGGLWSAVTVLAVVPYTSEGHSPSGMIQVQLSASSTGGPACGSTNKTWVVVDTTVAAGAFAAAVLQSARLSGGTVTLGGAGTCGIYGTVETLAYVTE